MSTQFLLHNNALGLDDQFKQSKAQPHDNRCITTEQKSYRTFRSVDEIEIYLSHFFVKLTILDIIKYYIIYQLSIVWNVVFICYNFFHLQYFGIGSHYKSQEHFQSFYKITIWTEFAGLCTIFLLITYFFVKYKLLQQGEFKDVCKTNCIDSIRLLKQWSVFAFVYQFRPIAVLNYIDRMNGWNQLNFEKKREKQMEKLYFDKIVALKGKLSTLRECVDNHDDSKSDTNDTSCCNNCNCSKQDLDSIDQYLAIINKFDEKRNDRYKSDINSYNDNTSYSRFGIKFRNILIYIISGVILLSMLCLGITSLMLKLSMFTFITDKSVQEWSIYPNCYYLFGFCNQIWNLMDENSVQLMSFLEIVYGDISNHKLITTRNTHIQIRHFKHTIKNSLTKSKYGWQGWLVSIAFPFNLVKQVVAKHNLNSKLNVSLAQQVKIESSITTNPNLNSAIQMDKNIPNININNPGDDNGNDIDTNVTKALLRQIIAYVTDLVDTISQPVKNFITTAYDKMSHKRYLPILDIILEYDEYCWSKVDENNINFNKINNKKRISLTTVSIIDMIFENIFKLCGIVSILWTIFNISTSIIGLVKYDSVDWESNEESVCDTSFLFGIIYMFNIVFLVMNLSYLFGLIKYTIKSSVVVRCNCKNFGRCFVYCLYVLMFGILSGFLFLTKSGHGVNNCLVSLEKVYPIFYINYMSQLIFLVFVLSLAIMTFVATLLIEYGIKFIIYSMMFAIAASFVGCFFVLNGVYVYLQWQVISSTSVQLMSPTCVTANKMIFPAILLSMVFVIIGFAVFGVHSAMKKYNRYDGKLLMSFKALKIVHVLLMIGVGCVWITIIISCDSVRGVDVSLVIMGTLYWPVCCCMLLVIMTIRRTSSRDNKTIQLAVTETILCTLVLQFFFGVSVALLLALCRSLFKCCSQVLPRVTS